MITGNSLSTVRRTRLPALADIAGAYDRYGAALALGGAFLLPLKLSLAYFCIIPLTVLWLLRAITTRRFPSLRAEQNRALLFFLIIGALTSLAGLDPLRSAVKITRFAFYCCTVFAYAELRGANVLRILGALMLGQTLAAYDSIVEAALPGFPGLFLGKVSESGQLCLTTLIAAGVMFALNRQVSRACMRDTTGDSSRRFRQERRQAMLLGGLHFLLLLSLCFAGTFGISGPPLAVVALGAASGSLLGCVLPIQLSRLGIPALPRLVFTMTVILPALGTALLVNLKRGPWLGVLIGATVLLFIHARRYIVPLLAAAIILAVAITPLRDRLTASSEHFFISGGRGVIWNIGADLSLRYPLGIGYENSRVLRQFSPEVPPELIHFHNNFLQVLVELGWFGLGIFLWWLFSVIRLALKPRPSRTETLVCSAIGCAVIGWQAAGLVEYNLGDSEVALVAFLAIGLLVKLTLPRATIPSSHASPAS